MLKKIILMMVTIALLVSTIPIPVFAETGVPASLEKVLKETEAKLWAGTRIEKEQIASMKSDGSVTYSTINYPPITDKLIAPMISKYMGKIRNQIADLGELSDEETEVIIKLIESTVSKVSYYWIDNNATLIMDPQNTPGFHYTITEARKKASKETSDTNAADLFFRDSASKPSSWAKVAVKEAIELGFVPERLQGDYQKAITKEEFASLFVTTIFASQKLQYPLTVGTPITEYSIFYAVTKEDVLRQVKVTDYAFTDTDNEDVKLAYIMGLVNGASATTFSPDKLVTRQEAAVMLASYGSPEACGVSDKDELEHFMPRYADLGKASDWAREALNLAFYRGVLSGTSGDKEYNGTSKITLDPHGNFTREQAIAVADRLYKAEKEPGIEVLPIFTVYLRGCILFRGDALGINWEVSKDTITAVSLTDALKAAQNKGVSEMRETMHNYKYIAFENGYVSNEAFVAAYPRIGVPTQLISREAMRDFAAGNHSIYDIGLAEYEGNNPNYVFQIRFKDNGFYTAYKYGGNKMLDIYCKKIK